MATAWTTLVATLSTSYRSIRRSAAILSSVWVLFTSMTARPSSKARRRGETSIPQRKETADHGAAEKASSIFSSQSRPGRSARLRFRKVSQPLVIKMVAAEIGCLEPFLDHEIIDFKPVRRVNCEFAELLAAGQKKSPISSFSSL